MMNSTRAFILFFITIIVVNGCSTTKEHYLIASTGTVIGVELTQNAVNQSPQAKLGYNRAELAIVPTNRHICVTNKEDGKKGVDCGTATGNGSKDTAEVLMELRYGGIFSWGDSNGIYQRLAVGETAVQQPGASVMFARNNEGKIDKETLDAIKAVEKIEESPSDIVKISKYCKSYGKADAADKKQYDDVVTPKKYKDFGDFCISKKSMDFDAVISGLNAKGINY